MDTEAITEQHRWLQQLVGDWTYETTVRMGADSTETFSGIDRVRALGEFWVIAEGAAEFPGDGPAKMVVTLGFDPVKKRYVGTFIHSKMSYLWHYDGELDGTRRILTLESIGPAMDGSAAAARYRDVIEIIDETHREFSSLALGEDGNWREFMRARYTRFA